jgi:uncharacterized membrane protein YeaQ/YmgE (transglycosylase-associated protein family)
MPEPELATYAQQIANDVLVWVGFGTLVGLLPKAIMPGRDPGGAVATLAMGIGGSVIGSGTLMYFHGGARVTPISPIGFLVATGGAFLLLFFYRLLGGRFFVEGDRGLYGYRPNYRRRVYREPVVVED